MSSQETRFRFGANWRRFLSAVDDERIVHAERSVRELLGVTGLRGKSFLDIGCGSGLFSLAARRLGARVHSFDYDQDSVECARELKRRFFADDPQWTIGRGSALDEEYVSSLGTFDVVYSWGVLHHTGNMWKGLQNAAHAVAPRGRLVVSIYNDQGWKSRMWTRVKRAYNRTPILRPAIIVSSLAGLWGPRLLVGALRLAPLASWRTYHRNRGMSAWTDLIDWVGGYPFEVARPEEIFAFYQGRGFQLTRLKTSWGGCNEFAFERAAEPVNAARTQIEFAELERTAS